MFCRSCGAKIDDSSTFCASCGAPCGESGTANRGDLFANSPLGAGSAELPGSFDVGGYVDSAFNAANSQSPSYGYTGPDYLLPNILVTLMCCFFPTSIVGIVFSVLAGKAKSEGLREKAIVRATVAKTLFWSTPVLAILSFVFTAGSAGVILDSRMSESEESWTTDDESSDALDLPELDADSDPDADVDASDELQ